MKTIIKTKMRYVTYQDIPHFFILYFLFLYNGFTLSMKAFRLCPFVILTLGSSSGSSPGFALPYSVVTAHKKNPDFSTIPHIFRYNRRKGYAKSISAPAYIYRFFKITQPVFFRYHREYTSVSYIPSSSIAYYGCGIHNLHNRFYIRLFFPFHRMRLS